MIELKPGESGFEFLAFVQITDVYKQFASTQTLRGVSFGVERGSFVSLVGPSGCGKSTLLRLIAGLEPLSAGTIEIDGRAMKNVPARNRDIAFVFQSYALYPHLTVRDNLAFSLKMRGAVPAERDRRIAEAARALNIDELLDRYPRQLSGGQRQRVAMGRAIVRDPKVFLFDEPLSNLDAELRVRMRGEIRGLHTRLGATTIYVTHDQVEAMTMADKVVVLRDGAVEQIGPPLELYDRPVNTFVAGFIGSPAMNILPGVVDEQGAVRLEDGTRLSVDVAPVPAGRFLCGIRPEHLALDASGVPATVGMVEIQGAETLFVARVGTADLTVTARERLSLAVGDQIGLTTAPGHCHLFDPSTTRRVDPS